MGPSEPEVRAGGRRFLPLFSMLVTFDRRGTPRGARETVVQAWASRHGHPSGPPGAVLLMVLSFPPCPTRPVLVAIARVHSHMLRENKRGRPNMWASHIGPRQYIARIPCQQRDHVKTICTCIYDQMCYHTLSKKKSYQCNRHTKSKPPPLFIPVIGIQQPYRALMLSWLRCWQRRRRRSQLIISSRHAALRAHADLLECAESAHVAFVLAPS